MISIRASLSFVVDAGSSIRASRMSGIDAMISSRPSFSSIIADGMSIPLDRMPGKSAGSFVRASMTFGRSSSISIRASLSFVIDAGSSSRASRMSGIDAVTSSRASFSSIIADGMSIPVDRMSGEAAGSFVTASSTRLQSSLPDEDDVPTRITACPTRFKAALPDIHHAVIEVDDAMIVLPGSSPLRPENRSAFLAKRATVPEPRSCRWTEHSSVRWRDSPSSPCVAAPRRRPPTALRVLRPARSR
jgi:hypothetical protein